MEARATSLECTSRLHQLLAVRGITVAELCRRLRRRGVRVNLKTLYRLADPTATIERLDTAVAGAVCRELDVALTELVVFAPARGRSSLRRLSAGRERRLHALLEKQAERGLSLREARELEALVSEAERLTLENARLLARARRQVK